MVPRLAHELDLFCINVLMFLELFPDLIDCLMLALQLFQSPGNLGRFKKLIFCRFAEISYVVWLGWLRNIQPDRDKILIIIVDVQIPVCLFILRQYVYVNLITVFLDQ